MKKKTTIGWGSRTAKPKKQMLISKRSGGEIPIGWMCMPIQWYERGKPLTYELSKTWYNLDLNHAIRVPNIVLENAKKSKLFSMSIDDDKRIKEQIQRQKND